MKHHIILIIHLLSATVWVGGHLFLLLRVLPFAWKNKNLNELKQFKNKFEPLGLTALALLFITGLFLAYDFNVTFSTWFTFSNAIEKVVSIKITLFFFTVTLAITAQAVLFRKYSNPPSLLKTTFFIAIVTVIAVIMLVLGSLIRIGGI